MTSARNASSRSWRCPGVDDAPLVHPLLATRWSPAWFDAGYVITEDQVEVLLEAARWAPSAGNSQPWAFLAGRRGEEAHTLMLGHLAGSSSRWAPAASLLVVNLCHRFVESTDLEYSEFAHYDLGQAVAHMTIQGQAMGLSSRQFRAFDQAGLAREFAVGPDWEVTTMTAFGVTASDAPPPPDRIRRGRDHLRWPAQGD
jgi:hypothetical protein